MTSAIIKAITLMIGLLTPEFKAFLTAQVPTWEAKAAETKNPWDDIAVQLLKGLLK